ncbi:TPA: AAA family ATPase, partial [Bacillus wiedmannii]|nr:AAA family ATPase [Bacillus wiedmannii]
NNQNLEDYKEQEKLKQDNILLQMTEHVRSKKRVKRDQMESLILQLCSVQALSIKEIANLLNRSIDTIRKDYVYPLVEQEKLETIYPENFSHPQQAYRIKN